MTHTVRTDLGGSPVKSTGTGHTLLSLLHLSDAHVMDSASPARCEWIELQAHDPYWKPLLHMHRPYEALTHWALAAHVDRVRSNPLAPWSHKPYDLALSTGDNIDNAQANELQAFLAILGGGTAALSAHGGVHEAWGELGQSRDSPWPFWCPDASVPDTWKGQGYPVVPDFVARASAPVQSQGLGFAWACLPGNHDVLRQGTALLTPGIEAIAVGPHKALQATPGFRPQEPLKHFVHFPEEFSAGGQRTVAADPNRRGLDTRGWLQAVAASGATGYGSAQVQTGCADTVIDTEHVRIILLDTNHPAGDYQGSVGTAQMVWLEAQLAEVDAQGRLAVLSSHHGSASLTNTLGDDPERLLADAVMAVAHRHPCVVAWLVGHRHVHDVQAHRHPGGDTGGFWEISTGSVIDWPSQMRAVEIVRHADGRVEVVCTLLDHGASADSLAGIHHAVAQRFAAQFLTRMQGGPEVGNVRLLWQRRK